MVKKGSIPMVVLLAMVMIGGARYSFFFFFLAFDGKRCKDAKNLILTSNKEVVCVAPIHWSKYKTSFNCP